MKVFGVLSAVIALLWFFGVAWADRTWGDDE
jgi:hypothetical protein